MELNWIIEVVKSEATKKIGYAIRSAKNDVIDMVKHERCKLIKEWFEGFDGTHIGNKKAQVVNTSIASYKLTKTLTIVSWTDSGLIEPYDEAEKYLERNKGELSQYIPSNEFVSNLSFSQGIIGLPERSKRLPNYSGLGWKNGINENFYLKSPNLSDYIVMNNTWDVIKDEIADIILKKIN